MPEPVAKDRGTGHRATAAISSNAAVNRAAQRIRQVLAASPVPEDPGHAENTLLWLLRMHPAAGDALRLAALAHDIERARPDRLQRHQFGDYDTFKQAHADEGADIADGILAAAGVAADVRAAVRNLIRRHETGGDPDSDLLRDADSLSYFDHNLPLYHAREGYAETLRRARWGYARLSQRARHFYRQIQHEDGRLNQLLAEACDGRLDATGA